MLKKITLPTTSTDSIDLAAINDYTKGIIIAYKDISCVGFVYFDSEYWYYSDTIDIQNTNVNDDTLMVLLSYLIKNKIANNFKLLEFV